ncbi:unnamed protein product [Coffea canephora]|uniref:Uncharacterized protein n=1 Tax=Coffea canephora TaxID=49390 RepID=A0A068USQ0_COFCA|nr:unnamed protein product [Coffea canephora]
MEYLTWCCEAGSLIHTPTSTPVPKTQLAGGKRREEKEKSLIRRQKEIANGTSKLVAEDIADAKRYCGAEDSIPNQKNQNLEISYTRINGWDINGSQNSSRNPYDKDCSLLVQNRSTLAVESLTRQTRLVCIKPAGFCHIYGMTFLSNLFNLPITPSWALLSFQRENYNLQLWNWELRVSVFLISLSLESLQTSLLTSQFSPSLSNLQRLIETNKIRRNEQANQATISLCLLKRSLDLLIAEAFPIFVVLASCKHGRRTFISQILPQALSYVDSRPVPQTAINSRGLPQLLQTCMKTETPP